MASSAAGIDVALLGQDGLQRADAELGVRQLRAVVVVMIVVVVVIVVFSGHGKGLRLLICAYI